MECPFCGSREIFITNSRPTKGNTQVWRRRRCQKCENNFTTHEIIDLSHLVVAKKSGKKEKYSRVKLYSGIYNATVSSRPTERQRLVEGITQKVEQEILLLHKKCVGSAEIGNIVFNTMYRMSPGAFLAYLTYNKNINSQEKLKRELKKYLV